jgi:hypothetical protein
MYTMRMYYVHIYKTCSEQHAGGFGFGVWWSSELGAQSSVASRQAGLKSGWFWFGKGKGKATPGSALVRRQARASGLGLYGDRRRVVRMDIWAHETSCMVCVLSMCDVCVYICTMHSAPDTLLPVPRATPACPEVRGGADATCGAVCWVGIF